MKRIALLVEGETERAFLPHLRAFLGNRLAGQMPRISAQVYNGRIPKDHQLKRQVRLLLEADGFDDVVALTDIYTGTDDFSDAADAKVKMRKWVGPNRRFHPHAAHHEFEAWLLPYWDRIQKLSGFPGPGPKAKPELVNHGKPASRHIAEAFRKGGKRDYLKPREAGKILESVDLTIAADQCPELKAFLNTFLKLGGGSLL